MGQPLLRYGVRLGPDPGGRLGQKLANQISVVNKAHLSTKLNNSLSLVRYGLLPMVVISVVKVYIIINGKGVDIGQVLISVPYLYMKSCYPSCYRHHKIYGPT